MEENGRLPNLFQDFSLFFFLKLKVKFRNKRVGKWKQRNQIKVCKHARRRNRRYYKVSWDENPQRENEMDSPSLKGFYTQYDCKLTYGNKNQAQPTLV